MPTPPKEHTPPPPDLRQAATALMKPAEKVAPPRAKAPAADSILAGKEQRSVVQELLAGKEVEKQAKGAKADKLTGKLAKEKQDADKKGADEKGVYQRSLGVFQDTESLCRAAGAELSTQAKAGAGRQCLLKAMLDVPGIAQVQLTLDLSAAREGGALALSGAADWTVAKVQHLGLAGLKPGTAVGGAASVRSDSGFEAMTLLLAAMVPQVAAADRRLAAAIYEGEAGYLDLVEEGDAEEEEGIETSSDDNSVNDKEQAQRAKASKAEGSAGDDEAARKQGAVLALKQAIRRVGWDIDVRGAGKRATLVGKMQVTPAKERMGDAVIAGAQSAAAAVRRTVQQMSVAKMPQEARTTFEQISQQIGAVGFGQVKQVATHDAEKVDLRLKLKMGDSGKFRFNVDAVRIKRFDKRMRPPGRQESGTGLRTGLRLLSVGG